MQMLDLSKELQAAQKALAPALRKLKKLGSLQPTTAKTGELADLLYDLRELKSAVGVIIKPITEDILSPAIKLLEEHFIMTLAADAASGVQGTRSRVQITPNPVPIIDTENDGFSKFVSYVVKNKQWDLLKRDVIARDAVRERWDAKQQVPGVTNFIAKKVSCTKLR
jgi:hypothetical protein